jgi:site-specific DNA recombinase
MGAVMTPIIAYLRVSSAEQRKRYGFVRQLRDIRSFCERDDLQIVEVIRDDYTGKTPLEERPEGKRIAGLLKSGVANGIVFPKTNRLGRDMTDLLVTVRNLIRNKHAVYAADLGLVPSELDLRFVIHAWEAQKDYENIVSQMAQGRRDKADDISKRADKRGLVVGVGGRYSCPFGYHQVAGGEEARIEVDPAQAETVIKIYDDYLSGHSTRKIAEDLNSKGIPAPRGKLWNRGSVVNVLAHDIYRGAITFSDVVYSDESLIIIQPDQWYRVEERRKAQKKHPTKSEDYLLGGGRIKGICGSNLTGSARHRPYKTYRYYRCWRREGFTEGDTRRCNEPMQDADDVEFSVLMWLLNLALFEDRLQSLINDMRQRAEIELNPLRSRLSSIEDSLAETSAEIERLIRRSAQEDNDRVAAWYSAELHRLSALVEGLETKRGEALARIEAFGFWSDETPVSAEAIQKELADVWGFVPASFKEEALKRMSEEWYNLHYSDQDDQKLAIFDPQKIDRVKARRVVEKYDVRCEVVTEGNLKVSCKLIAQPESVQVFHRGKMGKITYNVSEMCEQTTFTHTRHSPRT